MFKIALSVQVGSFIIIILHIDSKPAVRKCPVKGCGKTLSLVNEFKCKKCHKEVCLHHRFEDDHDCNVII